MSVKNVAVILAAGNGKRFGEDTPKQFLKVGGRVVLEYSMLGFQRHPLIDEFSVVAHPDYFDEVKSLAQKNNCTKLNKIIAGGRERYESSLAAIRAYESTPDINILLHDSARPVLRQRYITDVINALEKYNAVTVAVPEVDTIIKVNPDNMQMRSSLNRHEIFKVQILQGFKLKTLIRAYEKGHKDPAFNPTDDCGVVHRYLSDELVCIVEGEYDNMKLTYKQDLDFLEKYLADFDNL